MSDEKHGQAKLSDTLTTKGTAFTTAADSVCFEATI
jgi:hypothetical protein